MVLVCQIAITALLMIMPTLQRLPWMSCFCVKSKAKYDARKEVKLSDPQQHGLHWETVAGQAFVLYKQTRGENVLDDTMRPGGVLGSSVPLGEQHGWLYSWILYRWEEVAGSQTIFSPLHYADDLQSYLGLRTLVNWIIEFCVTPLAPLWRPLVLVPLNVFQLAGRKFDHDDPETSWDSWQEDATQPLHALESCWQTREALISGVGFTTVQHAVSHSGQLLWTSADPKNSPLSLFRGLVHSYNGTLDSTRLDRHGYVKPSKPSARPWSTSRTFSMTTVSMVFSPGYWRPNWARPTTSLGARTHDKPTTQVARSMQVDRKMSWLRPGSYPAQFCSRSQAVTGPKCETGVFHL